MSVCPLSPLCVSCMTLCLAVARCLSGSWAPGRPRHHCIFLQVYRTTHSTLPWAENQAHLLPPLLPCTEKRPFLMEELDRWSF